MLLEEFYRCPSFGERAKEFFGPQVQESFEAWVKAGYAHKAITAKIKCIRDFTDWLKRKHINHDSLKQSHVDSFLKWHRTTSTGGYGSHHFAFNLFLDLLRRDGILSIPVVPLKRPSIAETIVSDYREYLRTERCLKDSTVLRQAMICKDFLQNAFQRTPTKLSSLNYQKIEKFVLNESKRCSPQTLKVTVNTLRSFLRFLHLRGEIGSDMIGALPKIAAWNSKDLPDYLDGAEVKKLLACCDQNTRKGSLYYSMFLLMLELGLRAGEVRHLSLDDVDWHSSTIRVAGKNRQTTRMPMSEKLGKALSSYIMKHRPKTQCRTLFIRLAPPYRGFGHSTSISSVVARGLKKAGINTYNKGAHILRYTTATTLLQHGASLDEIGDVLRHTNIDTTSIYAKSNLVQLKSAAMPWPHVKQGARI